MLCWHTRIPQNIPAFCSQIQRLLTHNLAGGGSHNLGNHALRWESILHGNAGEMGRYAVLSVLPDKIARFLYEYHDTSYTSLALPAIPLDRSKFRVMSVFTASSHQIRYYKYVKYVLYA